MKRPDSSLTSCLLNRLTTAVTFILMGVFFVLPVYAVSVPFNIATNGASMGASFDGTNYLVGIENHLTSPTSIGAQMISTTGVKIGSLIPTGHNGIATAVAFDGMNHLLIWENDPGGTSPGRFQIYGQFISKAGTIVGSPFAITSAGIWFDGMKTMAFGNGKYLVTYTRLINPELGDRSDNRYIAGIIVNPDGSMGTEFRISTGYGDASDVAFDGTNFFVVWTEDYYDTEIRGRFVSTNGVPGTEISVNASAYPSDNPKSVTFDGTNYMVIWTDAVDATRMWDVFGQLVSPVGTLVGGVITISNENGPQMATTVSFDGTNYLATWVDMTNDANQNGACDTGEGSCWNIYGQYISKAGSLYGSKVTINADAGNQMGGAGFINGQYLAIINSGVVMGENGISQVDAVYGHFLPASVQPTPPTITNFVPAGPIGLQLTISGTGFVSGATTVSFNGTLSTRVAVSNPTQLTAYVPAGATTGPITITTAGGTVTSAQSFTVQKTLVVNMTGNGSGTVTATAGITQGFTCSSPATYCSTSVDGISVTLSATAWTGSTFSGWSDACSGSVTPCTFAMDSSNKTVYAYFAAQQNLRKDSVSTTYYSTLESAFYAPVQNDILMALVTLPDLNGVTYPSNPDFASSVTTTLRGGYTDITASTPVRSTALSVINNHLTVRLGTLILDQIIIK